MTHIQVASDGDENQITQQIDTMSIEDLRANFEGIMSAVVSMYGDDEPDPQEAA